MGNILNLPIPAVPVRLAAVAAFAVTLTDRRKGSPARADPYPGRENSAAGNFGLRARRGIFWHFSCKAVINLSRSVGSRQVRQRQGQIRLI